MTPSDDCSAPGPALQVAFIGGGINSAVGRAHFNAINLDGRFRLVAGSFSRDPDINRRSARFYGVDEARTHADFDSLLAAEASRLDAVIVLTPTPFHLAPILAALEAGTPVICEKALGATLDEWEAVRKAEQRSKGFLAVTYNYTGYPALRELRGMVRQGRLGRIAHVHAQMPQEGYVRVDAQGHPLRPQDWRLHDGPIPTLYLDLGVHLHQMIDYVTGAKPVQVNAFHGSFGHYPQVVDYAHAHVRYSEGIEASLRFGKSMLGYRNGLRIEVFGTRASATWEQTNPEQIVLADDRGQIMLADRSVPGEVYGLARYTRFKAGHPAGYIEAFANLYVDIAEALVQWRGSGRWQSPEVFGSELAGEGLRLLQAMADSAAGGAGTAHMVHAANPPVRGLA
jgi:predicted dehydrogenase